MNACKRPMRARDHSKSSGAFLGKSSPECGENSGSHVWTLSSCNLGMDTILACKRCEKFGYWRSTFPFLQGMIHNETTWAMTMIFASNQWFCWGSSLCVMETRPCAQVKSLPVVRPFWSVWNQPERVRHLAHTRCSFPRHKSAVSNL